MSKLQDKIVDWIDEVLPEIIDRTVRRLYFISSDLHEVQERRELAKLEELMAAKSQIEDCLADWKEELAQLEIGIKTKKCSSDIMLFSQNKLSDSEIMKGKTLSLELKIERDTRKINNLNKALDDYKIKGNKFYKILDYTYDKCMSNAEIAEVMGYTEETIRRRKLELIRLIYRRIEGAKNL